MNIQLRQQSLTKPELERAVLSNLRMLPGSQHVRRVSIAAKSGPRSNWAVIEIEPPLSTAAENAARNALSELQKDFLLA